jgi:hypothetical protein
VLTAFAPVTDLSPLAGLEEVYLHARVHYIETTDPAEKHGCISLIFETRLRFPRRPGGPSIITRVRRDPSAPHTFHTPLDWRKPGEGLSESKIYQ